MNTVAKMDMAQKLMELGVIKTPEEYMKILDMEMGVEFWMLYGEISPELQNRFPNAKKAAELKNSPLYRALL